MNVHSNGIIRRFDFVGRVCIPKEFRDYLRIQDGEPVEVYVNYEIDGYEIILKKHNTVNSLEHELTAMEEKVNSDFGKRMDEAQKKDFLEALYKARQVLSGE